MAAILAVTYPDLFAAVAVHSGLGYGSATSVSAAFSTMARGSADPAARGRAAHAAMGDLARPVPSIVVHGSADHTVAPVNGTKMLEQSMAANQPRGARVLRLRDHAPDRQLLRSGRRWIPLHAVPMDRPPRRPHA